jgi:hypothetical protein
MAVREKYGRALLQPHRLELISHGTRIRRKTAPKFEEGQMNVTGTQDFERKPLAVGAFSDLDGLRLSPSGSRRYSGRLDRDQAGRQTQSLRARKRTGASPTAGSHTTADEQSPRLGKQAGMSQNGVCKSVAVSLPCATIGEPAAAPSVCGRGDRRISPQYSEGCIP